MRNFLENITYASLENYFLNFWDYFFDFDSLNLSLLINAKLAIKTTIIAIPVTYA